MLQNRDFRQSNENQICRFESSHNVLQFGFETFPPFRDVFDRHQCGEKLANVLADRR